MVNGSREESSRNVENKYAKDYFEIYNILQLPGECNFQQLDELFHFFGDPHEKILVD